MVTSECSVSTWGPFGGGCLGCVSPWHSCQVPCLPATMKCEVLLYLLTFGHDISALDTVDHKVKSLTPWAKIYLSSFKLWVWGTVSSKTKLINIVALNLSDLTKLWNQALDLGVPSCQGHLLSTFHFIVHQWGWVGSYQNSVCNIQTKWRLLIIFRTLLEKTQLLLHQSRYLRQWPNLYNYLVGWFSFFDQFVWPYIQ